jgi:hypothetical protein
LGSSHPRSATPSEWIQFDPIQEALPGESLCQARVVVVEVKNNEGFRRNSADVVRQLVDGGNAFGQPENCSRACRPGYGFKVFLPAFGQPFCDDWELAGTLPQLPGTKSQQPCRADYLGNHSHGDCTAERIGINGMAYDYELKVLICWLFVGRHAESPNGSWVLVLKLMLLGEQLVLKGTQ